MQQQKKSSSHITLVKTRPLQILFIEDNHSDILLIKRLLRDSIGDEQFEITHAADIASAMPVLEDILFDMVLLDLNLLGQHDAGAVKTLHARIPETPIITFSGSYENAVSPQPLMYNTEHYITNGHESAFALRKVIKQALVKEDS
jgi:CheY-like chemotaxis protein